MAGMQIPAILVYEHWGYVDPTFSQLIDNILVVSMHIRLYLSSKRCLFLISVKE